jgi:hypothetical protein
MADRDYGKSAHEAEKAKAAERERERDAKAAPAAPAAITAATPEQLTAIVQYLAAKIGGAAVEQVDFILGIPSPPPTL